jgi:chromosome segregation ATPase
MGERSVSAAEARGREGLAWLTGVASLRRDTALMARQVLAWVQAVETQRGEARDEASAAEARCDELEQELLRVQGALQSSEWARHEAQQTVERQSNVMAEVSHQLDMSKAEVATLRAEVAALRSAGGAA